jgi:hypothetical protein
MMRARAMYRVTIFLLAPGTLFDVSDARVWDNGVALTPPMGFSVRRPSGNDPSLAFRR